LLSHNSPPRINVIFNHMNASGRIRTCESTSETRLAISRRNHWATEAFARGPLKMFSI
jgi:hypothetical protein